MAAEADPHADDGSFGQVGRQRVERDTGRPLPLGRERLAVAAQQLRLAWALVDEHVVAALEGAGTDDEVELLQGRVEPPVDDQDRPAAGCRRPKHERLHLHAVVGHGAPREVHAESCKALVERGAAEGSRANPAGVVRGEEELGGAHVVAGAEVGLATRDGVDERLAPFAQRLRQRCPAAVPRLEVTAVDPVDGRHHLAPVGAVVRCLPQQADGLEVEHVVLEEVVLAHPDVDPPPERPKP
jgi:hypothetical protein